MGGAVRRNTFSRWELDLLLDLDQSRIRKSARAEVLRRYARHIQQQAATEAGEPLRFSDFLEMDSQRNAISGGSP